MRHTGNGNGHSRGFAARAPLGCATPENATDAGGTPALLPPLGPGHARCALEEGIDEAELGEVGGLVGVGEVEEFLEVGEGFVAAGEGADHASDGEEGGAVAAHRDGVVGGVAGVLKGFQLAAEGVTG